MVAEAAVADPDIVTAAVTAAVVTVLAAGDKAATTETSKSGNPARPSWTLQSSWIKLSLSSLTAAGKVGKL